MRIRSELWQPTIREERICQGRRKDRVRREANKDEARDRAWLLLVVKN